jgi:hypothetical protein
MNRLISYWLSPIAAALLAGFVATVIAVGWWSRVPIGAQKTAPQGFADNVTIFPAVASASFVATSPTAAVSSDIALIGTVLPRGRDGARAVFRINGKSLVVEEGQDIAPGTTLKRVAARSVIVIETGGARAIEMRTEPRSLATQSARPGAATLTSITAPPTRVSLVGGCKATAAQRKDGIVLASELLAGALQNSTGLATLVSLASGKMVVQNSAGIGALIGLRDGDVLRTADGKPLTQANDIVARILLPVSQAQAVTVEITRESAPQVLHFLPPGCRG